MDEIPYRLPLVIGVTGHRDLREQDIEQLERAVGGVIRRLKHDYLSGPRRLCRIWGLRRLCHRLGLDVEIPIIVLSSLAEGADRLVARIAMKQGAKLIVPLPMPCAEYRRDFEPGLTPDAAAKFDELMKEATAVWQVPFSAGNSLDAVRSDEKKRALQYREVGLFIARNCHVLIALWNGNEDAAVGGTAEVVKFKRDGIPVDIAGTARASLDAPEIGPIIHVVTPRAKSEQGATKVAVNSWGHEVVTLYRGGRLRRGWRHAAKFLASLVGSEFPDDRLPTESERRKLDSWQAFKAQAKLTSRFNRGGARLARSRDGAQELDGSLRYLFDDPENKIAGDDARDRVMKLWPRWCALYRMADALAARWQRYFRFDLIFLFLLGFLGILSFEVTTHLVFDQHWLNWLLFVYSGTFLIVFAWFIIARWRQHQERFLDYRAFAEALRVAVFWKLVGIDWRSVAAGGAVTDLSSGDSVASAYPIRQPSELDWVKTCLRTLELLDVEKPPDGIKHSAETEGHLWARTFWVQGQRAFFRSRVRRHDHRAEVLENRSRAVLFSSIALAAILCMLDYGMFGDEAPHWNHLHPVHRTFIFLIGLLPGLAAVWTGIAERLAHKAQARQYDRMRTLFDRAYDLFQSDEPASFRHIQALYAELGAEAMKESAEWVAIYRQRPLQPP
jgi:hypothetical protein